MTERSLPPSVGANREVSALIYRGALISREKIMKGRDWRFPGNLNSSGCIFPHRRPRAATRGMSTVEVLVSLVIVSVGVLGNAALYFTAAQSKATAVSRMQAVHLVNDIIDRIRANPTAHDAYAFDSKSPPAEPSTDCNVVPLMSHRGCTAAEMATQDVHDWNQLVVKTLPEAFARQIDVDTTTIPSTYTVSVSWSLNAQQSVALTHSVRIQL
jgi:type IV pilus assembly protein PilV